MSARKNLNPEIEEALRRIITKVEVKKFIRERKAKEHKPPNQDGK